MYGMLLSTHSVSNLKKMYFALGRAKSMSNICNPGRDQDEVALMRRFVALRAV